MRTDRILLAALLCALALILLWRWQATSPSRDVADIGLKAVESEEPGNRVESAGARLHDDRSDSADTRSPKTLGADSFEAASKISTAIVVHARDDTTGEPLEGVRVFVWPVPPEAGFSTLGKSPVSDARGWARVEVPPKRALRLTTQPATDHAPSSLEVEPLAPGEERAIELRLRTRNDLIFVVRVVDDASGAPLLAARVRVVEADQVGEAASTYADGEPVDGAGFFETEAKSWKRMAARVEAPGYAWVPLAVTEGHETRDLAREVRLRRPAVVEALVADRSGTPLEGGLVTVSIEVRHLDTLASWSQRLRTKGTLTWTGTTDARGHCRIEGLPPAVSLSVTASAPAYDAEKLHEAVVLRPGETRALELSMGDGAEIRGWLRDADGAGVGDAELLLVPRQGSFTVMHLSASSEQRYARSLADGRFLFESVEDGEWLVGCRPGGSYAPNVAVVVVANGFADREVHLLADSSLFLRGHVLGPDDEPLEARVSAYGEVSASFVLATSNSDGSFELGPLVDGLYTVTTTMGARSSRGRLIPLVDLEAQAGTSGLVLRLSPGCVISGRVVDAMTHENVGTSVRVASPETFRTTTAPDGTFLLEGLKPGIYALSASTPAMRFALVANVDLKVGAEVHDLRLVLEPGSRLRVRYDGEALHASVRVLLDGASVASDGVPRGTEMDVVVPAGLLTVECTESVGAARTTRTKTVAVAVGELASIEFTREDE